MAQKEATLTQPSEGVRIGRENRPQGVTIARDFTVLDEDYVAAHNGVIELVGSGSPPAAKAQHDFGEAYVLPGAIDAQVNSRSQKGQEDFVWSTKAVAAARALIPNRSAAARSLIPSIITACRTRA